jgi:histidinol-phosphate phosphatase family protein
MSTTPIVRVTTAPLQPLAIDTPGRQPCVFLDRDGVINSMDRFVDTPEDLDAALMPQAVEALARLRRETQAKIVVVTNQGGVGMGKMSDKTAQAILARLAQRVDEAGGHLDAIYYCPTSPRAPHPEEGVDARKPAPGMLIRAAEDFGTQIDLADSYMIGDMTTDIAAGENATPKVTSILVRTGSGGRDGKEKTAPDHVADDLSAAVDWIVARERASRPF